MNGRLDAVRRWLVIAGLILGPVLIVLSVTVGLGPEPGSMRASFDLMAERAPQILAQDLLETFGFGILLGALVGVAPALRARGSALAFAGAMLSIAGIIGFAMSNAAGLSVVALAQLPDRDAAFQAASAISSTGPIAVIGTVGWILEIAGQLGILLVLAGLWRARVVSWWPLVLGVVGMLVNAVIGTLAASLAADVLLLAVMTWTVVGLTRVPVQDRGAPVGSA